LSDRDREILKDVIRTFMLTGEPVSSRLVSKLPRYELSAASIRNSMADLEEQGLLRQPHTSAGRVPTGAGYHLYIDSLMPNQPLSEAERRYIEENLSGSAAPDDMMNVTTHLLSELSSQIGIVMAPALGETVLKAISFVPLSQSRILCVVVSATGFVDNKVLEVEETPSAEDLIRISNYLTTEFAGLSLREIRDRLLARMAEDRAQVDRLLSDAIVLADRALEHDEPPELLVEGTNTMLAVPELADLNRVQRLLDTFSQKARLVGLLNQLLRGQGVRVLIGEDSDLTSDLEFSLVACSYGVEDRPLGTLGIFGPSRMPYQRVIPLVSYLGETLSRALERSISETGG
jgi:heat-inducible transcriptional repressor